MLNFFLCTTTESYAIVVDCPRDSTSYALYSCARFGVYTFVFILVFLLATVVFMLILIDG
uniref:Uncharacterized protein n=1 Tax=Arion vulgaris TaxID=1028688 RepID=A0A0B6Y6F8_9EUPU